MKTLQELLERGTEQLVYAGIEDAQLDAWYLMEFVFSIDRVKYLMEKARIVEKNAEQEYMQLIAKRASHVPLQHIIGTQEFMGLSFCVNEHVLIPRQDTELLVEEVLKKADNAEILDMCTGSGCIAISLKKLGRAAKVIAVDISPEALKVARENGVRLCAEIQWMESDLFTNVMGKYDIIVSNPPYIETREIEALMPEVKEHEPILALDGDEDGLWFYKKITRESKGYLKENGMLYYEIGYNQGDAVKKIMEENGFDKVVVLKDLAGLDRVVCGCL